MKNRRTLVTEDPHTNCGCASALDHIKEQLLVAQKAIAEIEAAGLVQDGFSKELVKLSGAEATARLFNALNGLTEFVPDVEVWGVDELSDIADFERVRAAVQSGECTSASGWGASTGALSQEQAEDIAAAAEKRARKRMKPWWPDPKHGVRLMRTRVQGIAAPGVSGKDYVAGWGE